MTVKEITDLLEQEVPLRWQQSYDNAGLIVGNPQAEVDKALLTVDITEQVITEAEQKGAGLIIAHHPVIFNPIKRLTGSCATERIVGRAIRSGMALYGCHTNLDSAPQTGINHHLARLFNLHETALLEPTLYDEPTVGIGIVGETERETDMAEFLLSVKQAVGINVLRHSSPHCKKVRRVAVCSGSGGSLIGAARAAKADLYLSGDFRYHDFVEAMGDITIADIGHFESEYCAIEILFGIIRKKIPTFALCRSEITNPVNYL